MKSNSWDDSSRLFCIVMSKVLKLLCCKFVGDDREPIIGVHDIWTYYQIPSKKVDIKDIGIQMQLQKRFWANCNAFQKILEI